MDKNLTENVKAKTNEDNFKLKAGVFFASVAGLSAAIGFGTTLAAAKKQDPKYFDKGVVGSIGMTDTGAGLALRALGWGTVFAFGGCGILFYSIWKLSGARDLKEFRVKMGEILPRLTKTDPPTSRTEFSNLTDLLTYLSADYGKSKPKS
ncbi:transmembrane protein 242 [Chrysoperla carnea]|uniref:transmembrane protein 242 n=1 Tax=Chrysoperla carnea TaxID=189513 RepID=UPI001D097414|nr:transmembrane protein 242 [Chrysoperla carnea]